MNTIEWAGIETSFAQPAVVFQGLVERLSQAIQSKASAITEPVKDSSLNPSQKIDVALQYAKLDFEIRNSAQAEGWLAASRKLIATDDELVAWVDLVGKILAFQETKDEPGRALVERIASEQRDNKIGKLAAKLVGTPGTARRAMRTWVSANGNFQLKARFQSQKGNRVTLLKNNGDAIQVEISKLCQADIQYLQQQK